MGRKARLTEHFFGEGKQRGVLIDAYEGAIGKAGKIGLRRLPPVSSAARCQHIPGGHGQHNLLLSHKMVFVAVPLILRQRGQAEIQLSRGDHALHRRDPAFDGFHLYLGEDRMKSRIYCRKHFDASLRDQPHHQASAVFFGVIGNLGISILFQRQHLPGCGQISRPGRCGLPVAAGTDEQRRAQFLLQLLQLLVQGALRHKTLFRRPGDALFIGDANDIFQQMQIHDAPPVMLATLIYL